MKITIKIELIKNKSNGKNQERKRVYMLVPKENIINIPNKLRPDTILTLIYPNKEGRQSNHIPRNKSGKKI